MRQIAFSWRMWVPVGMSCVAMRPQPCDPARRMSYRAAVEPVIDGEKYEEAAVAIVRCRSRFWPSRRCTKMHPVFVPVLQAFLVILLQLAVC